MTYRMTVDNLHERMAPDIRMNSVKLLCHTTFLIEKIMMDTYDLPNVFYF